MRGQHGTLRRERCGLGVDVGVRVTKLGPAENDSLENHTALSETELNDEDTMDPRRNVAGLI